MIRVVIAAASALAVGAVIAWFLAKPKHDWRAAELTAWCNRYRERAITTRGRIDQLARALGPSLHDESKWRFLHASEAEWQLRKEIHQLSLTFSYERSWLLRCANAPIPMEMPSGEDPVAVLRYLDRVIESLPQRDPDDPREYVQPIEEPDRLFFAR